MHFNLRTRLLLYIVIATLALLPASAQTPSAVNWTQFKNSPNHTGFNPAENTISKSNATSLQLAWQGLL